MAELLGVLVGFLTVGAELSLTLFPACGTLFPYWTALSSLDVMIYAWYYYGLLYHVWLMSLGGLFFSEGKQKIRVDFGGREGVEEIGGRRGKLGSRCNV